MEQSRFVARMFPTKYTKGGHLQCLTSTRKRWRNTGTITNSTAAITEI